MRTGGGGYTNKNTNKKVTSDFCPECQKKRIITALGLPASAAACCRSATRLLPLYAWQRAALLAGHTLILELHSVLCLSHIAALLRLAFGNCWGITTKGKIRNCQRLWIAGALDIADIRIAGIASYSEIPNTWFSPIHIDFCQSPQKS